MTPQISTPQLSPNLQAIKNKPLDTLVKYDHKNQTITKDKFLKRLSLFITKIFRPAAAKKAMQKNIDETCAIATTKNVLSEESLGRKMYIYMGNRNNDLPSYNTLQERIKESIKLNKQSYQQQQIEQNTDYNPSKEKLLVADLTLENTKLDANLLEFPLKGIYPRYAKYPRRCKINLSKPVETPIEKKARLEVELITFLAIQEGEKAAIQKTQKMPKRILTANHLRSKQKNNELKLSQIRHSMIDLSSKKALYHSPQMLISKEKIDDLELRLQKSIKNIILMQYELKGFQNRRYTKEKEIYSKIQQIMDENKEIKNLSEEESQNLKIYAEKQAIADILSEETKQTSDLQTSQERDRAIDDATLAKKALPEIIKENMRQKIKPLPTKYPIRKDLYRITTIYPKK